MNPRSVRAVSHLGLLIGLLLCAGSACSTSAQPPSSADWHSVQALPAQTLVRISTSGGAESCYVDSVSEDRIACSSLPSHAGTHHEFTRDQVTMIRLTGHFNGAAAALTAAGFTAIGAGIGATQGKGYSTVAKPVGIGVAGGLGVGVVVGYFVGHTFGRSHGSIVYRRP